MGNKVLRMDSLLMSPMTSLAIRESTSALDTAPRSLLAPMPLDDTSPTSPPPDVPWHPRYLEDTTPFEHDSTSLFDSVRIDFQRGISTLSNLLQHLETSGSAQCRTYHKRIDSLLESLVNMARWLVTYVEAAERSSGEMWARSAILGLRVDLYQYSTKVGRVMELLKRPGSVGSGESVRVAMPLKGRPALPRLTTSWTESARRSQLGPRMARVDCA